MVIHIINFILKLVNFYLDRREEKTKQKKSPNRTNIDVTIHISKNQG